MRWEGQRESEHIEDRRGEGGGAPVPAGLRLGGGRLGLGGLLLALAASWLLGINPMTVLGVLEPGAGETAAAPRAATAPPQDRDARFVRAVLASTEDSWGELFAAGGQRYQPPRLVLFRGGTDTACGQGQAAMGPFYCPADQQVYIDLSFYDTLQRQLGAPGDFAQAYVIAHEVGHHVQQLLGTSAKVEAARRRAGTVQANALSVRLELQADCYAGLWAHHSQQAKGWLEQGDVEEALNAASRIGDDALQQRSQGRVVPESFTHGSSRQRVAWFRRGLDSGRLQDCDTFAQRTP